MQIAATTSQAALTASPRLSATIPKETAPSAATAAHKSFVCSVFELLSLMLIASSRTAAKDKHNSHADDIDQVQSCQNATYAPQQAAPRRSPRRRIASSFDGTSDRVPWLRRQLAMGAVYPPGSVIQLIPTEAMVKHDKGFNAATHDWEFFELDVSKDGTQIRKRGTVDVVNRFGGNCFGCHSAARPQWDLVCETDHGCAPLPVTRAMIGALQRTDPAAAITRSARRMPN